MVSIGYSEYQLHGDFTVDDACSVVEQYAVDSRLIFSELAIISCQQYCWNVRGPARLRKGTGKSNNRIKVQDLVLPHALLSLNAPT